ncbi:FAD binding domain-containing protein [Sodiomyces alkalinus F11]|uniref:FAD binding domain-containing protein n=1 Tax=Sodiomyces alkalinus (strain CBS 110278 / VKM F-3762 / F11) TaxID=1314773 RepID=A0A3N2QAJ8_SODAK|nr:FAD binding domain-containing protein [Sodiomyces alkalinus F11]ROT43779.1 FAD binding domain-containing protein [Sodiomyces alkalinus F11]
MKFPTGLSVLALALRGVAATREECHCCRYLVAEESLQGKVLFADDQLYETRLASYYSANAALSPWCMVLPTSTADVSKIAEIFSSHSCPFGMRSGAHSAFRGSNGVDIGVTVDFAYLNGTTYDAENKIVSIQPGSNWGEAYTVLDPYGVTAVGGRASVVGVGGFTTGGGYSFHTNSRGFACDNVVNFEVVLASGEVVNANAQENPDLWKALKGGSGNFGFVTRIDQAVVESTQMWGGFATYDQSKRDDVFRAYLRFVDNMASDPASANIVALNYDGAEFTLRSILTNTDALEAPPAFDEYSAIDTVDSTLRVGAIAELVPEFTGPTPLGLYASWLVGMTKSDLDIMAFIDEKHKEYVASMTAAAPDALFNILIQFQPVTESIVRHGAANGGNVLGLEAVVADGPALMWLIVFTVDTEENQDILLPLVMDYRDAINARATQLGVNSNWDYLNYAFADQDPIATYGEENVRFLREVSDKFDPSGVFQKLRKTGFKIPAEEDTCLD